MTGAGPVAEDGGLDEPGPIVETATIRNRRGLHARAAAKFVSLAEQFDATVTVVRDDQEVSALSIMGLMMLGAGQGSAIEVRGTGRQARQAVESLAALVGAGFNEQE